MENARKTAVKLLCRLEESGAYSNILLDEHFSKCDLDEQGKKFCAALFYGTIERRLTLDEIIKKYSQNPGDRLGLEVKNILRTAIYQLLYMNSVPDSAAVNEAVKLASKCRNPALKGFVNALLRSFLRADKQLPAAADKVEALSLQYSCPQPLVKKWLSEYGETTAMAMLSSSLGRPPITAKVNTVKTTTPELIAALEADGFGAEENAFFADCVNIFGASPEGAAAYKEGKFHVQDISCRFCCEALDLRPGMMLFDMCAAPGGKSFTAAQLMENSGSVFAFDLHENRVRLIKKGALRLGLDIIKARANDAKRFNERLPLADRVLCDVPCSGLGVIRRKPEIKYKELSEFSRLPQVQYDILSRSADYLKPGGLLVYSTCTLSRAENDEVAERFLREHKDFEPSPLPQQSGGEHTLTITPDRFNSDGFFIARFKKKRS